MSLKGFVGLESLDKLRYDCWQESHRDTRPVLQCVSYWGGHKVLSLATIPLDLVAVGVGTTGMLVTASTVGTVKVLIFAVTQQKPTFPTGYSWFFDRTAHAAADIASTLGELLYDVGNIFYQVVFLAKRLAAGVAKANEAENFEFTNESPSFIKPLNDLTAQNRIDWNASDRPFNTIMKHYFYSMANIPLNLVTATCSAVAAAILSSAYVSKVVLYAFTNINIPLPTYAGQTLQAAATTSRNVLADSAVNFADGFVLVYKGACALRLNKIMATAMDILRFIPEAVFS